MKGLVVIGTDTMIGKTMVSTGLIRAAREHRRAHYWKPLETGIEAEDETADVLRLAGLDESASFRPEYRFRLPLSVHLASRAEGVEVSPERLIAAARNHLEESEFLVVETAGGVLVPITHDFLQIDFLKRLELPVLLVAPDRLGAINHTLLTIEACRARGLKLLGVVLNRGVHDHGNAESIAEFGHAEILARFAERTAEATVEAIASHPRLRALVS